MKSRSKHSKIAKHFMIRVGLGALILMATQLAFAESPTCGKVVGKVLFSAHFDWKSPAGVSKGLRLVIARNAKPGFKDSKFIAQIMNGDECQAVCRTETVDVASASLDLSCRSAAFGALAAPATVFFHNTGAGHKSSVLRFGTWLQGYEQTILNTELDRSARLMQEMAPPPVKLARSH